MAITEKWRGICANIAGNNNKFWEIELHDNSDVITRWGRISEEGKAQQKTFSGAGKGFFDTKIREKMNKSKPDERYTEARTVEGTPGSGHSKIVQSANLVEIAKREINSNSADTIALIERLAAANIHNIVSQTTMTFNKVTGLFETPLGIVTANAIAEARDYLRQIGDIVAQQSWTNPNFASHINGYMRLIPSDFGRQRVQPRDLFPDLSYVQKQNDILDSLDTSLQMALQAQPAADGATPVTPRLFETTLHLVDDDKVVNRISELFLRTLNRSHACAHLRVKKVYSVEIQAMSDGFKNDGLKVGNIHELWHGSKISNVLSILKSGLMIPKPSSSHCTGRLFGDNLYFAPQSTKSLNYSYGYWGGSRDSNCFMFLADVACGKTHVPSYGQQRVPIGYDSMWAKPGQSGIQNDEVMVPRVGQANLKYLIEFA